MSMVISPPDENTLKRRISELQHYRTMGITTFTEAERYDRERLARVGSLQWQRRFNAY
jgi:transcriptional adapter 2-alpha